MVPAPVILLRGCSNHHSDYNDTTYPKTLFSRYASVAIRYFQKSPYVGSHTNNHENSAAPPRQALARGPG